MSQPSAARGLSPDSWADDRRSVGELLRAADALTRRLLHDVDGDDAPGMLRTWPEAVQSAAELWRELPRPEWTTSGQRDHAVMTRLDTYAQTMHRSQVRAGWPGEGPPDARLLLLAQTFTRASDLIARHHRQVASPHSPSEAVRADVEAARVRLLQTLNVGSHAVGLAVRRHVDDESVRTHFSRNQGVTRAISRGKDAMARLEVFERLTAHVGPRLVAASRGEHFVSPPRDDRLREALVRWDIHAHRAASYSPTPANLAEISRTQVAVAITVGAVLRAGEVMGQMDAATARRLAPEVEGTVIAWEGLGARWSALTTPATRGIDQALLTAAEEVHAAVREVTHDRTAPASSQLIAERVDIREVAHTMQEGLVAAADLAHIVAEAARDGSLVAPARAMMAAHRSLEEAAPSPARGSAGELGSPVDPGALQGNRPAPLSGLVRVDLVQAADAAVAAAGTAMAAASPLQRSTAGPAEVAAAARQAASRRHEERTVQMVLPLPASGWAR